MPRIISACSLGRQLAGGAHLLGARAARAGRSATRDARRGDAELARGGGELLLDERRARIGRGAALKRRRGLGRLLERGAGAGEPDPALPVLGVPGERRFEARHLRAQRLRIGGRRGARTLRRRGGRGLRQHVRGREAELLGERRHPRLQHREIGRIGRRVADQPGPKIERRALLAALEQGKALIEPRPRVARLELERALERTARLLGDHAARGQDRRLGQPRMELGLAAVERERALVGALRLGRILAQLIGTGEAQPALEVVRRGRDPLLEPRDHGLDRRHARRTACPGSGGSTCPIDARGERHGRQIGPPETDVQRSRQGRQRDQQGQRDRPAPAAGTGGSRRGAAFGIGREHPPLDLEARGLGLLRREQPALGLALELAQLGAIDAQIVLAPGRDRPRPAQHRQQHERQHQGGHHGQNRPQAHPALLARPCFLRPARSGLR